MFCVNSKRLLSLLALCFSLAGSGLPAHAEGNSKFGYIDKTGAVVIPARFDRADLFQEGLASVTINGKSGFIDKTGNIVIPVEFASAVGFSEGLSPVTKQVSIAGSDTKEERYGYIDKTATVVIEPQFEIAVSFNKGVAAVKLAPEDKRLKDKDHPWCFIDRKGQILFDKFFRNADWFQNDFAIVKTDSGTRIMDKNGNLLELPEFSAITNFGENCALAIRGKEEVKLDWVGFSRIAPSAVFEFINNKGQPLFSSRFDGATDFSEGLACVLSREWDKAHPMDKWAYIDKQGKVVLKGDFNLGCPFSEGIAPVATGRWEKRDGRWDLVDAKWGYIDKTGKQLVPCTYQDTHMFREGMGRIESGGKYGFVDSTGKVVINPQYETVSEFAEGLAYIEVIAPEEPPSSDASESRTEEQH